MKFNKQKGTFNNSRTICVFLLFIVIAECLSTPQLQGLKGDCPTEEWEMYGAHCYLFRPDERVSWDTAQSRCAQEGGKLSFLPSIHNSNEDYFIADRLRDQSQTEEMQESWIGLRQDAGFEWKWTDDTIGGYTNWADSEPNDSGTCVEMYADAGKWNGKWNDHQCSDTRGFACKVKRATRPPVEAEGTCPDASWEAWGEHCYLIRPDEKRTWQDAQNYCQSQGGKSAFLASIHHYPENDFISRSLLDGTNEAPGYPESWLGMKRDGPEAEWYWVDDTAVMFDNWATDEPAANGDCAEMYIDPGKWNGYWNDHHCTEHRGFVCKVRKMPIPPEENTKSCPTSDSWEPWGKRCFLFKPDERYTWKGAQDQCKSKGGNLASMHDPDVDRWIGTRMLDLQNSGGFQESWIGVYQDNIGSDWKWLDKSAVDYTNWADGEPSSSGTCGQMYSDPGKWNGKWDDHKCEEVGGYVCMYQPGSLSAGAIIGIIIGVLVGVVLLGFIGVVGYNMVRRKQGQPELPLPSVPKFSLPCFGATPTRTDQIPPIPGAQQSDAGLENPVYAEVKINN